MSKSMPKWRNGRRKGLKILRRKLRAGSSPALGTIVTLAMRRKPFFCCLFLSCRYSVVHARVLKAFLFAKSYGVIIIDFLMFLTYRLPSPSYFLFKLKSLSKNSIGFSIQIQTVFI